MTSPVERWQQAVRNTGMSSDQILYAQAERGFPRCPPTQGLVPKVFWPDD